MEKSNQELYEMIQELQITIKKQQKEINYLNNKYNDLDIDSFFEMINALTECVDKLLGI